MSFSTAQRTEVPAGTTVYDAFPSLKNLHRVGRGQFPDIRENFFWETFNRYKPYTCLSLERFYNIYKSIEYIARAGIRGDLVECGVFLGGSILGAAQFAQHFGMKDCRFYIYDTFAGFPVNTVEKDISGTSYDLSTLQVFNNRFRHIVERNIAESGIDASRFVLIEGPVEETLKEATNIGEISYLRLDTDYYESTMVELTLLYPRLSRGGVLIIDDYGHFEGARAAVDDYFSRSTSPPFLQRTDYTGRCGVKV